MQNDLKKEMSKLKQLLDKEKIKHTDFNSSFNHSIYENITFVKNETKFTVSRREHYNSHGELLSELIRVDEVTSVAEKYGYFKHIFNLPVLNFNQPRRLVSFSGNYIQDLTNDYLLSLSILL